jgi:hypothetical protein
VQKNDDLLLLDADTGALTTVLSPGNGGDPYPSPDGTWLALARSNSFSVSGIDGSGMHANVGVFTPVLTYSEYAWYPILVWAADSSQYGVIIPSVEQLGPSPSGSIWTVTAASGAASLVSTLPGQFLFPTAILSPDLAHLGYAIPAAAPSTDKDLYVSHLDGSSGLHLSTNANNAVMTFSPDGQYFSYYIGDPGTTYIGSLGGGTLPLAGNVVRLTWADPVQFVYAVGSMASWTLNLGTTGGATSVIATPAGGGSIVFDVVE